MIFDTGDLLVLRDLTEIYNWSISDHLYMGTPDPRIGNIARISKKSFNVYIYKYWAFFIKCYYIINNNNNNYIFFQLWNYFLFKFNDILQANKS